jgi:hypothetical protein
MRLIHDAGWYLESHGEITRPRLMLLEIPGRCAVTGLGILLYVGWVLLPVTWGYYWRTRLSPSHFIFAYFIYIAPVAALAYLARLRMFYRLGMPEIFIDDTASIGGIEIHRGWTFDWIWVSVYGLSGFLLALLMYFLTLRLWGRSKA